jgi:hypothetical protein
MQIRNKWIILVLVVLLINAGCARVPRITPSPTIEATLIPGTGILTISKAGITITAKALKDGPLPSEIYRYFTPFYVSIRNNLDYRISLSWQDFILLDGKREQYNAIMPEEVVRILTEAMRDQPRVIFGWEKTYSDENSELRIGWYYGFPHTTPIGVIKAIAEGTIYPYAQISGYIFFLRIKNPGRELMLIIQYRDPKTGEEIDFRFPFLIS